MLKFGQLPCEKLMQSITKVFEMIYSPIDSQVWYFSKLAFVKFIVLRLTPQKYFVCFVCQISLRMYSYCKIQTEWVPRLKNSVPYNNAAFQIRNAHDPVVLFSCLNEHLYRVECRASSTERVELRA